jgi:predicted nucleotidyltransferase
MDGDLSPLAAAVSGDLTAAGIEHVLTGALALAVYGYARATKDIDVVVLVPAVRLPAVFEIARRHGFTGEDRELISQIRARTFAQMKLGPTTLDVIVPVLPYHERIVRRAQRVEIAGRAVPLVTAEDLFVIKSVWHRPKDVADLQVLARKEGLDAGYIRETLASLVPPGDPVHAEVARLLSVQGTGRR